MSPNDRNRPENILASAESLAFREEPTVPPAPADASTTAAETSSDAALPECEPKGRRFGDYELIEEIARGGMGVVYKARQLGLNRVVALKMILSGDFARDDEVRRFRSEAEAAARLEHPGIVPIHEIGSAGSQHFYTMSYVDGSSLMQFCETGIEDPNAVARLVRQIAEAVDFAHKHGIVHRDLKPANILLDKQGIPHITDFGLAKCCDSSANLTRTGQIVGTPGYMAPEQAAGDSKEIGAPADIYAIGGILYFLLTGRPPFRAANVIDTLVQSLESPPVSPLQINPSIPKPLEQICMRCLERIPEQRYRSALDVAKDLDCFLQGLPIHARPPSIWQRVRRLISGSPGISVHVIALALLLSVSQLRYLLKEQKEWELHVNISGLLLGWILLCLALHWLPRNRASERIAGTALLCIDAALVTALFSLMSTPAVPPGPLLVGYPLIVVAGAMYLDVARVVIVTVASMISYVTLLLVEPSLAEPIHYHACFFIMLLAISACMIHQVRRVRTLKDYFESRR